MTKAALADPSSPNSLSTRFRRGRDVRLRALIEKIAQGRSEVRILDLGGSVEYWRRVGVDFLKSNNVRISVLNLTVDELRAENADSDIFSMIIGDACDLKEFGDGHFDLVHSNSVIEHVGNWARMKKFADEVRRTGRSYYVQTPYYWFPVEPHFYKAPIIHWLPRPLQARLLVWFPVTHTGRVRSLDAAFGVLDGTQLLDRSQMRMAFPDAEIVGERLFGLTKSLTAIRHVQS